MSAQLSRRQLLLGTTAAAISLSVPGLLTATAAPRKFYSVLSLGRIGFEATFPEAMELATKHGFEGLDPDADYFASLDDASLARMLGDLRKRKLKFGAAGLPVDFRKDAATFHEGLKKLPGVAARSRRGWRPALRHSWFRNTRKACG